MQYAEKALKQTDDEKKCKAIRRDAGLLSSLLLQDLETTNEGDFQIKQGVAQDRILSVSDPEMRHGRKSSQHRFDGHKAAVATDTESNLITAVDVIAGNAHDSKAAVALVEASEKNTGNRVETALGDSAFGTAAVREQFEDSETELVAKVPKAPKRSHFTKYDFHIDLEQDRMTCPAGHTTTTYRWVKVKLGKEPSKRLTKEFVFDEALCQTCPLPDRCINSDTRRHKTIRLHPREDLLQKARADAQTETFKTQYRQRVAVEHSIARLVQRGIWKSRYFGRRRTLWQLAMAAAVVNFMHIAGKMREERDNVSLALSRIRFSVAEFVKNIAVTVAFIRSAQLLPASA